jgi:multiple sugar transport system permease protein
MSAAPLATRPVSRKHLLSRLGNRLLNVVLVVLGILMIAPVYWLLVTAVAPESQRFALPPHWFPTSFDFSPFGRVFDLIPLGTMFLNSLKITTIITVGSLATSALAAYAFARLRFRGRDALFLLFLAGLMVPPQITVIPVFIGMRQLHLVDNQASVYLPALVNVLGTFLLRQYFLSIPRELDDAAKIDGAGHLKILRQIILPLSAPALSALAIFIFQAYWNDFFWPNIFLSTPSKFTLPLGLVALRGSQGEGEAVVVFAAITLVVAPLLLLVLVFQRALVRSVASTAIKG